jgi:hypothetical protein
MTVTNVHIAQEAQELLIKAAAAKNVSVERLASEILAEGIQVQLSELETSDRPNSGSGFNPLANLQPYAFYAKPEESALSSDEWSMESEES